MDNLLASNAPTELPITLRHTYRLAHLPFRHRDPFDRLLVGQALAEHIPLLNCTIAMDAYGVEHIW